MIRNVRPGPGPRPEWFAEQYRSLIRATHTHAELDVAILMEESMLPRSSSEYDQDDVRETPARMDPWCPNGLVGYLSDAQTQPDAETAQE